MNNCYVKGGDFNVNKLTEHKNNFNLKYQNNEELCRVVSDLVQIDEVLRPDPTFLAKKPQVVYDNVDHINKHQLEETPVELVEVPVHTFQKKRTENLVNNAPPVNSKISHPLDHEEHYVKPGEEVIYGEPKTVRTYVDENSRRAYKGDTPTEVVRLKNAYDPNRHEEEKEVSNQYKSIPYTPVTVHKKQSPNYTDSTPKTTYVNSQPNTTYTYQQPETQPYVNSQPTTTYTYEQPQPQVEAEPYVNSQPKTTYTNEQPQPQVKAKPYVNSQPKTTYTYEQPKSQVETQPNTTYTYEQPQPQVETEPYVNSQPITTYEQPQPQTYVNSEPKTTNIENPPKPEPKTKELKYDVSRRQTVQFHNLKFDNHESETEPENRFEEPVLRRQAENGEDLSSIPPEGRVIRSRVKIKDAEGNIVEEYEEPVK